MLFHTLEKYYKSVHDSFIDATWSDRQAGPLNRGFTVSKKSNYPYLPAISQPLFLNFLKCIISGYNFSPSHFESDFGFDCGWGSIFNLVGCFDRFCGNCSNFRRNLEF